MFQGFPCALPHHLKGKKHNDWLWPLSYMPRSYNARGPRCTGREGYIPWPPILVEGFGVSRWETSKAESIIEIPELRYRKITDKDVYGKKFEAIERNPGNIYFNKTIIVNFPQWEEARVIDEHVSPKIWLTHVKPNYYHPSALQKFSSSGYLLLEPYYYSKWKIIKKNEVPGEKTKDDIVLFMRRGYRPDSLDVYYNKSLITAGFHWE